MAIVNMGVNEVGRGSISIDGQEVHNITGVTIHARANEVPAVILELAAVEAQISLDGASVSIGGTDLSETMERAMLVYLLAKYGPVLDSASLHKGGTLHRVPYDGYVAKF